MTKEEAVHVKAVSGDLLFGYDNTERIRRLNVVYAEVQKQIREKATKATQFKEAIKKMARKPEKDAATQVVLQLVQEAEELKVKEKELKMIASN